MEGTFFACRPFQYGPSFPADMIDLHQVFEMRNEQNDEALLRLRFAAALDRKAVTYACRECPRKFTTEFSRERHGRLRHDPLAAARRPVIKDDDLPPIDTNDPNALIARARLLRHQLKTMAPADGFTAPNPDAEVDAAVQEEEKLLNEIAPVPWDKTAAAMKAGDVKVPEVATAAAPRSGRRSGRRRTTKKRGA